MKKEAGVQESEEQRGQYKTRVVVSESALHARQSQENGVHEC